MFKKILLIVVNVSLATIVSCSSVRKNKSITKEDSHVITTDNANTKVIESGSDTTNESINKNTIKQNLSIEYEPKFDLSGNLIPFNFYGKDEKGNATSVNINGNGKVKYFTENQMESTVNNLKKDFNRQLDSLAEKRSEQVTTRTIYVKDKTVAPDYLKYIIGIIITLLLFSAVILIMYLYFKKKLLTISKKLI